MNSPLSRICASGPADPEAVRRMAGRAWHENGVVLINPAWLTSMADRQQLADLADKVHGSRKRGG